MNLKELPLVSVCTPTFNRRPFIPMLKSCILKQTYPHHRIEWIVIDDGSDKIQDVLEADFNKHAIQLKYFPIDEKMTLGAKRNFMHKKTTGDIIVYFDDDDYYPPERIHHAVETLLKHPEALCAGSSIMYIYFKHISKMYQFGPYGPNHATAATFAFHKRLLTQTHYEDEACLAEEKHFLKDYTVPFVQLDPLKTILVFSHVHNTFDKKKLLETPNLLVKPSARTIDEFIQHNPKAKKFFLHDIDELLKDYEPGEIKNKPDVLKQIESMSAKRKQMEEDAQNSRMQTIMRMTPLEVSDQYEKQVASLYQNLKTLTDENSQLREKNSQLEKTITKLIKSQIEFRASLK